MMLPEILKELRGSLTQEEVAKKLGLSRARYSHYENGRSEPDNHTLEKLADFYNVSIDYLLGRTNKKNSEVTVAGQDITLSQEEYKIFLEIKKHPVLFHDLAKDPEKKVKELIRLQKARDMFLEDDDESKGKGFGELDD